MSPFEFLDHMLEKIHDYPHKARHYNKTLLKSIKTYKKKYKRAIKNQFKGTSSDEMRDKRHKYESKIAAALDLKVDATRNILVMTSSVLAELEALITDNHLNVGMELPPMPSMPNVVRAGSLSKGTYCECKQPAYGDMICCDSLRCKTRWFHFKCVFLSSVPKGSWYCSECRKDWRLCRLE